MNDNEPNNGKQERGGWLSAPDYTPQSIPILPMLIISAFMLVGCPYLAMKSAPQAQTLQEPRETINSIYWSDADSGRINGSLKFRLNGIDAPETGGVGAAIGGAECELERERGFASKEWIVTFTRDVELSITQEYGLDKYDRLVIDLSAGDVDVGNTGISTGHLKPWPHKGRRALSKKPDWCEQ